MRRRRWQIRDTGVERSQSIAYHRAIAHPKRRLGFGKQKLHLRFDIVTERLGQPRLAVPCERIRSAILRIVGTRSSPNSSCVLQGRTREFVLQRGLVEQSRIPVKSPRLFERRRVLNPIPSLAVLADLATHCFAQQAETNSHLRRHELFAAVTQRQIPVAVKGIGRQYAIVGNETEARYQLAQPVVLALQGGRVVSTQLGQRLLPRGSGANRGADVLDRVLDVSSASACDLHDARDALTTAGRRMITQRFPRQPGDLCVRQSHFDDFVGPWRKVRGQRGSQPFNGQMLGQLAPHYNECTVGRQERGEVGQELPRS